jgi:hypothetical protein
MTSTPTTINEAPCGALWYTVVPAGATTPAYAGLDRVAAIDRVVALLAQGQPVEAGERFRSNPGAAYVTASRVRHVGESVTPVPDPGQENAILAQANVVLIEAGSDGAPMCAHGSPARRVVLTDRASRSDNDPYRDVMGPESIEYLASMEKTLAAYNADCPDRYTLAFIHADMCRSER